MPAKGQRKVAGNFDPEFRFLLEVDPALEGWRAWVAEYWTELPKIDRNIQSALTAFLVSYLHGQGLHTLQAEEIFARDGGLPAPDAALRLGLIAREDGAQNKHDAVSDFLDWILRHKLSIVDAEGHPIVPSHLANPFPRRRVKNHGKQSDLTFSHVLQLDPKLEDWRRLAAEWLKDQKSAVNARRTALDKFLIHYIHGQNLERNFGRFLLRDAHKPDFTQVVVVAKREGKQTTTEKDVKTNNYAAEFLDWVLAAKLGDPESGTWDTSRFHNPIKRLTKRGVATNTQSNKTSLSIRYIRELRGMLAEGRYRRAVAAFVFDDKGICPNGSRMCDVGGEKLRPDSMQSDFAPVPGFPQERNCVCCRFFLTGPAFLPGLIAHFNTVSEKTHRQSDRYSSLQDKLTYLEDEQREAERENLPFARLRELDALNKHVESEALILNKYMNDLQATNHLIQRSIQIAEDKTADGVKLVAKGSMTDLKVGFIESESVLHQLEVLCENAVIYPDIDHGFATIRRSQMLDAMMRYNGMEPVMMYLDQDAQLLVGNAVMQLIQARTGSIQGALPYAECRLKLEEIGIAKRKVLDEIAHVKAQMLIDHAKTQRTLALPKGDPNAS